MYTEELKAKQQSLLPGITPFKKADNSDEETLYAPNQKGKPEFKSIDPKSVNGHQKNEGGYKRGSDLLSKQEAGANAQTGGTVQKKKNPNANGPTDDDYKQMIIGKEQLSNSTLPHVSEKDEYYTKNTPKINFNVQFNGALPQAVKTRLEVIAFYMLNKTQSTITTGDFVENSITSFAVSGKSFDLTKLSSDEKTKYGGNTVFEFMRLGDFKNKNGDITACVQVRELGQDKAVAADPDTKQKQEEHFKKFFTLDPSFSDTGEIERLYSAVYKLPESILSSIPKTPFKREAVNIDRRGQHPETLAMHVMNGLGEASITVYDSAFNNDSSARYGDSSAGFFGAFEQAILHEIGHAFNGRKVEKALRDDRAASDAMLAGFKERTACAERKGKGQAKESECKALDKKVKKLEEADKAAEENTKAARTETGQGYDIAADDLYVDKDPDAAFRKALVKDGKKAITQYGAKELEENYAELFSLYFIDEVRLKKMRPAIHEYFATNYPKNP